MSDGTATCLSLTDAVIRAYEDHSWERLRRLYHDQALLVTVAGGDAPLGPDETIATMRQASMDFVRSVVFDEPSAIDAHAAVVSGTVGSRLKRGGFSLGRRGWAVTFKDKKVYRLHVAESVAAANRCTSARE